MNSTYDDAVRYDQYFGAFAELPEWLRHDLLRRRSVLELACGTGRISIPLAEQGIEVCGLDLSSSMLGLAREKAAVREVNLDWVPGDMRDFDLGRRFGSVLLLFNAIWHLHEPEDVVACLSAARNHLVDGGRFILDVFVPSAEILSRDPLDHYPFAVFQDAQTGEEVQVTETTRYEPHTQISHVTLFRSDSGEVVGDLSLKMYFPRELDVLLGSGGMTVLHKYGAWDRRPFGADAQHQLYVCTPDRAAD